MEIKETAVAGTLESSDIQIMLSKGTDGIANQTLPSSLAPRSRRSSLKR